MHLFRLESNDLQKGTMQKSENNPMKFDYLLQLVFAAAVDEQREKELRFKQIQVKKRIKLLSLPVFKLQLQWGLGRKELMKFLDKRKSEYIFFFRLKLFSLKSFFFSPFSSNERNSSEKCLKVELKKELRGFVIKI